MRRTTVLLFLVLFGCGAAHALTCFNPSHYQVSAGRVTFHSGGTVEVLRGIDGRTFRELSPRSYMGSCRAGYGADRNTVLYEGKRIKGADVASFRVIGANQLGGALYASDRHRVYAEGVEISKAVESFRVLDGGYATDGNRGFFGAKALPGEKFTTLGDGTYAKSTAAVFMRGEPLEGLDPQIFDVLPEKPSYGRDANKVVRWGRVIEGADPDSFAIVAASVDHARDKRAVYYRGEKIARADPATIRQIHNYYFRDRRAVYMEGREIAGADPATFRMMRFGRYAADARHVYRGGVRVEGRDAASFHELQSFYTVDKNGVYYRDEPMAADAATFWAPALGRGEDRWFRYSGNQAVCKHDAAAPGKLPLCR